ncbi:hypothetical protein [Helicobacter winghamensis]|uniref:Lipoprotein n=1 Tax=Helicobacter winghamensis TaxID=157268 RepID=A0A2N3PKH0_9HELI|nr:hypothetical protein [Helicobacter winghamensis]EEO25942.1 hypothetical protein HWAG_00734 [Helicobacter winghamensis ATCC BAA-430]PKT76957.1 hypothetical protein BCM34_07200 [Helicobacter winghamensis]PKT77097.1 hypothetical protein BCM35_03285 [Helicobacter winghamensis]PKT77658.1 hypothetical protein BCM32_05560 [Helicobacter winghamensis]PKT81896.1 hypothetical protein BCM31_01555 [Helicobacter winghamensis]
MFKEIIFSVILIVFLGCESVKSVVVPQKLEEAYIQATRKAELITKERVQVVLIATHLNTFNKEKYPQEKGEVFFIDVYQSFQHGVENPKGFFENGFHLTLNNGETPIKITPLQKGQLEGLMHKSATPWGEYYLVEFMPQDKRTQNSLQLLMRHKEFGENYLNFGFKPLKKEDLKDRR